MKKLLLLIFTATALFGISQKEMDFRFAMNKLWNDHGVWTHDYLVANIIKRPLEKLTAERLMRNQDDIGNAIATYYGKPAGKKLAKLLKEHIAIAVDVVNAAKENKQTKLKESQDKWDKNAQDIAKFLSDANPNYSYDDLVNMLRDHLDLTTQEAIAVIKKNGADEVRLYDEVRLQLDNMAKGLADGIIKQFPSKFK